MYFFAVSLSTIKNRENYYGIRKIQRFTAGHERHPGRRRKAIPMKKIAPLVKGHLSGAKAESTLRNELNGQPGYKLGFHTAVLIMLITKDITVLDMLEKMFGRVAFTLPVHSGTVSNEFLKLVAKISKEFSETLTAHRKPWRTNRLQCHELTSVWKRSTTSCPPARNSRRISPRTRWRPAMIKKIMLHPWLLGFCFCIGLLLGMSDGPLFPWINFTAVFPLGYAAWAANRKREVS